MSLVSIRRGRTVQALAFVKDRLLGEGDIKKEQLLLQMAHVLANDPEKLLLLIGLVDGKIQGHLIGFLTPGTDYVWIYEAVYDHKAMTVEAGSDLTLRMMEQVRQYAIKHARPAIQMQTTRSAAAWERKWGFKKIAEVLEYRMDREVTESLFEEITTEQEKDNEQRRHESRVSIDVGPTTHNRGPERDVDAEGHQREQTRLGVRPVRTGTDTVHGSTGGGPTSGDRHVSEGSDADESLRGGSAEFGGVEPAVEWAESVRLQGPDGDGTSKDGGPLEA